MSTNTETAEKESEQTGKQIPEALKSRDQWFCWLTKEDGESVPINPTTEERANPSDPSTLVGFETAKTLSDAPATDAEGLGFAVTEDDPLVRIWLEDAVTDGEPESWAEEIIEKADTYAEYGPEKENIYLFAKGTVPEELSRGNGVEMFDSKRLSPITGNLLERSPASVEEREAVLNEVYQEYIADEHTDGDSSDTTGLDDENLLSEVRETVLEEFGKQTWDVTEAALSVQATLLLSDPQHSTGLVIVGEAGAGKTTVLRFFEGLEELVYRSDDATPASFVSHDASLSEEQLREEVDLLPRIQHKTLLVGDMSSWFSGGRDTIEERMSTLARLMDGDGYTTDSGTHGERGYKDGDYRFAILGANTPLQPRAWNAMGHTGNRFVFHEKAGTNNIGQVVEEVTEEDAYTKRVKRCQEVVHQFLTHIWDQYGGYRSVEWNSSATEEIREILEVLTRIVQHSRAPIAETGEIVKDSGYRVSTALWEIAQAHALLRGETQVALQDMDVCARIALSTMPKERRPVVRAVLNPDNDGSLSGPELTEQVSSSKPTVLDRMELLDVLGIADCEKKDGRGKKVVERKDEFEWPDSLDFPEF
ncbi:hypothetical protein AMS69_05440 [Haloarcula rubripromontorii]|uniref:Uncharacterized protein n=1 Tax=Haloarcula rubripromontorii TaxID=1705562 RepID=A0A0M9AJK7_9EURY|nr:hypothetical protein [Haloarcula rubripromontorii]KOX93377.1 hypothetical protein AMS69_05440 [Haloarcula rubripromontorii]